MNQRKKSLVQTLVCRELQAEDLNLKEARLRSEALMKLSIDELEAKLKGGE